MRQEELISNFFPLLSNLISHYQYLGIVLITGVSILLLQAIKKKDCPVMALSIITAIILIIYLILGLFVYRESVLQYSSMLDLNGIGKQNLSSVLNYILYQSWLGIIALAFFISSFIVYMINSLKGK